MNTNIGTVNSNMTLTNQGINGFKNAFYNLSEPDLLAQSLLSEEGVLGIGGTLMVET